MNMKISSLLFTLLLFSICVQAQTPSQDAGILSIKKTKDFEVSGKGDAANWKETSFVALTHRKGNKHYSSQFKILYSEKGIYCLYVSQDSLITSTIREDFADIYNEDVVEVFFWPNEKSNIYFEYELSPYNYELPILVPNYDSGTSWRANFYRIDYDNNTSQWSWMATRKNFHDYEKFGRIIFE